MVLLSRHQPDSNARMVIPRNVTLKYITLAANGNSTARLGCHDRIIL
jgi:hypothetical protein